MSCQTNFQKMASFDFAWQQRLSIATRCLEAAAEREKLLKKIEAMNGPCRAQYLRHHREQIINEMNKKIDDAPSSSKR